MSEEIKWQLGTVYSGSNDVLARCAYATFGDGPDFCEATFEGTNATEHARKLVAADDLLAALQSARSFVELVYSDEEGEEAADAKLVLNQIDAAIARATGDA